MITQYYSLMISLKRNLMLVFSIVTSFFMPVVGILCLIMTLVGIDTVTGIYAAHKNKQAITSRKLFNVVTKTLLYSMSVLIVYTLNHLLLNDFIKSFTSINLFAVKVISLVFCGIELTSIHENVEKITGINYFNKAKELLTRAKEIKKEVEDSGFNTK